MKYLIAGLGNIGPEYANTRHNIGFQILNRLAASREAGFESGRYAFHTRITHRGRQLILIKPTTYMNLSGKAVRHWLNSEKIPLENLLVITDDLALDLGELRLRTKGGDGGHNGLTDIIAQLGTNEFSRLRIGIGDNFRRGYQSDFVLGDWSETELIDMDPRVDMAIEMILSFVSVGPGLTMTRYNKK